MRRGSLVERIHDNAERLGPQPRCQALVHAHVCNVSLVGPFRTLNYLAPRDTKLDPWHVSLACLKVACRVLSDPGYSTAGYRSHVLCRRLAGWGHAPICT